MPPYTAYVVAAYLLTALALGGYTWWLFSRARSARRRAEAVATRREARAEP